MFEKGDKIELQSIDTGGFGDRLFGHDHNGEFDSVDEENPFFCFIKVNPFGGGEPIKYRVPLSTIIT